MYEDARPFFTKWADRASVPISKNAVPRTREALREIWVTPKAPVESRMSAATIWPAITKEKTAAAPNLGIAISDATR